MAHETSVMRQASLSQDYKLKIGTAPNNIFGKILRFRCICLLLLLWTAESPMLLQVLREG
jgi:hypothetical protein